ncbi:response regulator [Shewanella algicola]|uniref:response regulator n=1 Tax=Shewanella algicola TaxID=640633 RepID=UPI0024959EA1|nr:response regulator [Shewanella algicola]
MKTLKPSEIAFYCDVHQRTVSRWIAQGQLKGHKLPGRGNYRVLLSDFILFLQTQNMPMPTELLSNTNEDEEAVDTPSNKRILIIDDETEIRNAIRRVLAKGGYVIDTAADGFQAGVKILRDKPKLITLDLSMPGLDGFDVLTFIRAQPETADIKIVVISGLPDAELHKALELGANAVLPKPFENTQLISTINNLLK